MDVSLECLSCYGCITFVQGFDIAVGVQLVLFLKLSESLNVLIQR